MGRSRCPAGIDWLGCLHLAAAVTLVRWHHGPVEENVIARRGSEDVGR